MIEIPLNMTPEFVKEYLGTQIQQSCRLPSPEQIFKYVCDKYNGWLIWYLPVLVLWYCTVPVIANIIYKIWIVKKSEEIQNKYAKYYKMIYDSFLSGIIFFGLIIWLYMSVQNGTFEFIGIKI